MSHDRSRMQAPHRHGGGRRSGSGNNQKRRAGRRIDETIRQIQAFQLVRETKGAEATPSGWTPGKATLKPGPGLAGKVWKAWKP